jgi:hypothetical protein
MKQAALKQQRTNRPTPIFRCPGTVGFACRSRATPEQQPCGGGIHPRGIGNRSMLTNSDFPTPNASTARIRAMKSFPIRVMNKM